MNKNYVALFEQLWPDFFVHNADRLSAEHPCEEMLMFLKDFDPSVFPIPLPDGVTFGYYTGERAALVEAVRKVSKGWVPIYEEADLDAVYCGYQNGVMTSFCLIEDMGEATLNGKTYKVGGPGCVGTVPEYRRRGIGLAMIRNATEILKDQGYDVSYIHWTGVAHWYAKLGYETFCRWTRSGIIEE